MTSHPTPAEEFARLIRGEQPEPATNPDLELGDDGQTLLRRHRPPKPDHSQASGATGKAPIDPGGAFAEAIRNAAHSPLGGRV